MKLVDNLKNPIWNLFYEQGQPWVLSILAAMPVENEVLDISANGVEMAFLSSFNILVSMLFSPTDLFGFREDIIFFISYLYHIYKGFT